MKLDKLLIPVILLIISLQVWIIKSVYELDANDQVQGNELRIIRERVKNIDAQFQDIVWDVALRKAQDMIKSGRIYK